MREFARGDAERIFRKPVAEWDGYDLAFFNVSSPLALDEALTVALLRGCDAGVGAIAVSAHILGSALRHEDPATAAQYAEIGDRIVTLH